MTERLTLHIEGMTCDGCENSVRRALERLDGVESADPSHSHGVVEVAYDPERVGMDELRDAIEEAGYDLVPG